MKEVVKSTFVISLDFELHWGVCDSRRVDQYHDNLIGVREAIPRILDLFEEYGIHATWATVGLLFYGRRDDLLAALPSLRPTYENPALSAYNVIPLIGEDEASDPFHFGRDLLERIRRTPHQEIATHTFSHYYCIDAGQTVDQFRADLAAALEAASTLGVKIDSIVFPRNQISPPYVAACAEFGIRAYRGRERSPTYTPAGDGHERAGKRVLRLLDSYVNLTGDHAIAPHDALEGNLINIPASRFLRPFHPRLRSLEPLKRRRITQSMTRAAERGQIYHLWWHPHNFGVYLGENAANLRAILEHYRRLAESYGMRTRTMGELATELRLTEMTVGAPTG